MLLSSEVMTLAQEYAANLVKYGRHVGFCQESSPTSCLCGVNAAKAAARSFLEDFPPEPGRST